MTRRWRPRLPVEPLEGRFLITQAALGACQAILPTFRGADGDHEGIVFLCGRELVGCQLITTAIAPRADHGRGHVMCDEAQVDEAVAVAQECGLGLLAQVHTHPSALTEHSEGDDTMVLMPYEGMLSIVVPWYGHFGMTPFASLGVHQFRRGGWIRAEPSSVAACVTVVPEAVDLR